MRTVHRFIALVAAIFGLWVGGTGTAIQIVDLRAILGHAPANDPNVQAIRDGRDGPPNFQVLVDSDFDAQALPSNFDFDGALNKVINATRTAVGDASMRFVELRMLNGQPVGNVAAQDKALRFDALTGAVLVSVDVAPPVKLPPAGNRTSLRNTLKNIHRMTTFGNTTTILFFLLSLMLLVMIVSGLAMYYQLWRARARMNRSGMFWSAGGNWRSWYALRGWQ
jgi:hypothetical protein